MRPFILSGWIAGLFVIVALWALGCSNLVGPISETTDSQRMPLAKRPSGPPPQPDILYRPRRPVAKIAGRADFVMYEEKLMDNGDILNVWDGSDCWTQFRVVQKALTEPTVIGISMPMYGDLITKISQADCSPHGIVFQKPCTMKMSYKGADLTGIDESEICAWYWNEDMELWEYVDAKVNVAQKTVEFELSDFSRYALGPAR